MKIKVNGKEQELQIDRDKLLLSNTLELLGYKPNTIVVELNDLIINSVKWDKTIISNGDKLEIVSIVGGG